ncbi:MAG: HNH endonuclease, partial [Ramlibacter sp.]|nr:HNH endonuclease [Cryobacterium sp.]
GVVLSVGRDRYKVPKDLKKYLRIRDETCRFPGCNRSAAHSDIDHSLDWQFNGLTAEDNLAHLCPPCHALKSETGWTVTHLAGGTLKWRSPSGRTFVTEPAMVIRAAAPEPPAAPVEPVTPVTPNESRSADPLPAPF